MANFYALLIGIDYYQPNPYYGNLKGAVRDIDKVADYLEKSLKIPTEQITRLTSPLPDTNSLADVRSARGEMPPTYQNIVNAFKSITERAKKGDLVYIHYSGHGGRVNTIFPELKGEGQYDESLAPMDLGNDGYYLRDVEIATLLKRMTDAPDQGKGLIVTVIFDSCHSGGATRNDGEIRGSRDGEPDTKDRPKDSVVANRDELVENWRIITQNSKKEGWLPNQREYVFLGACRPSEVANEGRFDGKDPNGALTYWMIDTLTSVPGGLTYQVLYDRLKGKIQSKYPSQLPMLLGEGDRLVFGDQIKPVQYSLTVIKVAPGKVTLDGGMAQGLSRGTQFALYPVGSDFTDKQKRLAVAEVTELQASTSTAKILSVEESGVAAVINQIQPGLPAVMESAPLDLKHRVRLHLKEVGNKEYQLPQELADKQAAALEKVRQKMQRNGWLTEVQGNEEEAHYQVAIGREGEYEISSGTPIKNLNPALSIDDAESPAEVVKRLVHLGKYQTAQALDNPASELTNAIEYELLDDDEKQPFPDPNNISLKSGDRAYVRLKNISDEPLNVAILNFEPTWWKISQSPIEGDRGAFYSLQQGQQTLTRLHFQVPDGNQQSEETLKLFVTRGIANFQWLILPPLNQQKVEEVDQLFVPSDYLGKTFELLEISTRAEKRKNSRTQDKSKPILLVYKYQFTVRCLERYQEKELYNEHLIVLNAIKSFLEQEKSEKIVEYKC
ncbi:caspase family protein [Hassallia byssoidea VB512170]|uniref:Caspase family protein n=1 Tax=Hassallia byssoidea VB512170 TaxID=1304833 RepID=A0A846HEQ3_9CYAN|nr:caspase family protein [Hassalia byssoidea]NEU76037.1 caspase family protein [Hassalia byssoidea VB512170]